MDLIISIASLLLSFYIYIVYGRKLKKQSLLLNAQQQKLNEQQAVLNKQQKIINKSLIEEAEEKKLKSKQAEISGTFYQLKPGCRCLRVFNKGNAVAKNIRIEGIDVEGMCLRESKLLPYESLNSQDSFELHFFLFGGCPEKISIKYIWDDEKQKDNELEQMLQI